MYNSTSKKLTLFANYVCTWKRCMYVFFRIKIITVVIKITKNNY